MHGAIVLARHAGNVNNFMALWACPARTIRYYIFGYIYIYIYKEGPLYDGPPNADSKGERR